MVVFQKNLHRGRKGVLRYATGKKKKFGRRGNKKGELRRLPEREEARHRHQETGRPGGGGGGKNWARCFTGEWGRGR